MISRKLALSLALLAVTNILWAFVWFDQTLTITHMQDEQDHLHANTEMLVAIVESKATAFDRHHIVSLLTEKDIVFSEDGDRVAAELVEFEFSSDQLVELSFPLPL